MSKRYMEDSIDTPLDALYLIRAIALDYDGFRKAESLMELIDELRMIAETGILRADKEEQN